MNNQKSWGQKSSLSVQTHLLLLLLYHSIIEPLLLYATICFFDMCRVTSWKTFLTVSLTAAKTNGLAAPRLESTYGFTRATQPPHSGVISLWPLMYRRTRFVNFSLCSTRMTLPLLEPLIISIVCTCCFTGPVCLFCLCLLCPYIVRICLWKEFDKNRHGKSRWY